MGALLQVEEILPGTKFEKTSTTLTPPEGDAVYEYEYYYEYYEDPNYKNDSDLNVAQSLTNSESIIGSTIRPKIEEFQNIERFQEIQQTTKQPSEQFSIQNFLNLLTNQENTSTNSRSDQTSTTEVTISTAGTSGAIHPKNHLLPAIGEMTKGQLNSE